MHTLTNVGQELRDRVLARAGHAANGADRHALAKKVKDLSAIGRGELFHAEHDMTFHA